MKLGICRIGLALAIGLAALSPAVAQADESSRYVDELIDAANAQKLADREQWHALLHYRSRTFDGVESDIDSPQFFLHDDGADDPEAELEATLTAFFDDAPGSDHPQCRFPARYRWLDEELEFDPNRLPERDCHGFDTWREELDADSVTLIYAVPYLEESASMYGHTLLRLDRGDDGASELDSRALDVAAEPWTDNPLLYTVLGVVGGFDGGFETTSFAETVHHYVDRDRRALWEYELDIAGEQVRRMIAHLWELQPARVDYRFVDENCSYFLLSMLEVADPSLQLVDQFSLSVLPTETVRAVVSEGLVDARGLRPSSRQMMVATRERLEGDEIDLAYRLGAEESAASLAELEGLSETRRGHVLDAALALWRFENPPEEDAGHVESQWAARLREYREGLDVSTPPVRPELTSAPEEGHAASRITLAGGFSPTQRGHVEIGFRPLFHDLTASAVGYRPLSQLEVLDVQLRAGGIDGEGWPSISLQQLDVVDIASLRPLDRWAQSWSWSLESGLDRTYLGGCGGEGCLYFDAAAGVGATVEVGPLSGYLLVEGELAFGSAFDRYVRLGVGPRIGSLLRIGRVARLHLEGRYRYPVWGEGFPAAMISLEEAGPPWSARAVVSISPVRNLEFRVGAVGARNRVEAELEFHVYF